MKQKLEGILFRISEPVFTIKVSLLCLQTLLTL
uniref:Uncharacterized protein n=1 Tax=Anguilla anguilla TaxID=7936 RepID=A0A0E9WMI5_ANGAN